jgi:hypothetical protein
MKPGRSFRVRSRIDSQLPMLSTSYQDRPGKPMPPRCTQAEALYADQAWRPAQVLGWLRPDVAFRQPITEAWVFWLVQLQLPGDEPAWFEYDSRSLRPLTNS